MAKKAKFWTFNKDIAYDVSIPIPAKKMVPKWYKDLSRFHTGEKFEIYDNGSDNLGVKSCVPFYEAITSGYLITLHCDLFVETTPDGVVNFKWQHSIKPIVGRSDSVADQIPRLQGFTKINYAWEILYSYLLPKGYSALVTQPLNRYDLPFMTTSGIVDADKGIGTGGVPFALKEGFSGVIKKGTPIIQVIPFKRDDWKTEFSDKQPKGAINWIPTTKTSWYKSEIWKRKKYE